MDYLQKFESNHGEGYAQVVRLFRGQRTRLTVMAVNASGFSDWPIQYDNGNIAYDHPEQIPQYVKVLVHQAFSQLTEEDRSWK